MRNLAVIFAVLLLTGCATMNRSECETADWQAIGYEDGAAGKVLSYLGNHRKACAEYAITPDMSAYRQGRLSGLEEYCIPAKGFSQGRSGSAMSTVCPEQLSAGFERAWLQGREVHQAESQQRNTERALNRQRQSLKELDKQIAAAEKSLVSDGIGSQRRKELLAEVKKLTAERMGAEGKIPTLEIQLAEDKEYAALVRARYDF